MKEEGFTMLFQKFAGNPVLGPEAFPSDIMYVFNPGAIRHNGEYLLVVDAATAATPIVFWIARSRDGIHFTPDPGPIADWPTPASGPENCIYDPRITFICTMDLSEIGGAEGEFLFPESGDVTQVSTARFAVGDTITAPDIANFTALTDLSQHVATVTEEVAVVYRPWRLIMANCGFLLSDSTTLSSVRNVEIYVDLGDTLQAPDLGELYTFDADATSLRSGIAFPLVIDAGNIYNGMSLELVYDRVVPFKVSELNDDFTLNEETATWYVLRIRGSKIISSQVGDDGMLICNANVTVDDGALWTIAEAPDGSGAYLLYNKANPGKVLCDVQGGLTYPEFADITGAEMGFDLVNITNGYGLRLSSYYNGQENVMINDLSNAGHIGYWDNAAAWSDAGSTITFEEYDPDNYTFLKGRAYLNAQDCIGGFTAEQLAGIREYIESGDVEMESEVTYICENELDYIPAEERVQFNPDHVYAIISASPEYIQKNNVQYALCASEDSVLSWKEFTDATDKNFQFILKMEKLQAADPSRSTTICQPAQPTRAANRAAVSATLDCLANNVSPHGSTTPAPTVSPQNQVARSPVSTREAVGSTASVPPTMTR